MAQEVKVKVALDDAGFSEGLQQDGREVQDFGHEVGSAAEEISNINDQVQAAGSMGNFKRELREATKELLNLQSTYTALSDAEKNSDFGRALHERIGEVKNRAGELKDMVADLNQEINTLASDTGNFDAFKQGIEVVRDSLGAMTSVLSLTGNESKNLEMMLGRLAQIYTVSNALITVGNALQRQSALMVRTRALQERALTAGIALRTAAEKKGTIATIAATAAQKVFNAVAAMNPYVLLAMAIAGVCAGLYFLIKRENEATEAEKKHNEELKRQREEAEHVKSTVGNAVGDLVGKYMALKAEYSQLKTVMEKNTFWKSHKTDIDNLGLAVKNLNDLDAIFVSQSDSVIRALKARAEATAYMELYTEQVKKRVANDINGSVDNGRQYYKAHKGDKPKEGEAEAAKLTPNDYIHATGTYGTQYGASYNYSYNTGEVNERGAKKLNQYRNSQGLAIQRKEREAENKILDKYTQSLQNASKAEAALGKLHKSPGSDTSGSGSSGQRKPREGSLVDMENKLAKMEKDRKEGYDTQPLEEYTRKVTELREQIDKKKIELGIETGPAQTSLAVLENKLHELQSDDAKPKVNMDVVQDYERQIDEVKKQLEQKQIDLSAQVEVNAETSETEEDIRRLNIQLDALEKGYQASLTVEGVDEWKQKIADLQQEIANKKIQLGIDPSQAEYSINQLEAMLSQLQKDYKDGIRINISKEEYVSTVEYLTQKIKDKKIEMGLETGPAENSIAALEAKISDFKKKYLNGTLVITPEVYDEQIKSMEKELQDKKIKMKVIVDPTVEKVNELNTSYTNIQRTEKKSSFQTAVESVTPAPSTESGTNEERLAALQKEMDFNDQLIEQLEKLRDEYAKLGDAGAEGFQKVNDEIGKLNEKQTEYAEETKEVEKADKKVKKQAKTFQAVGDAVGNVGNALSALGEAAESPELNVAGIIAQAVANVMLGYASASTQAADLGPWAWIAFAASGLAIALSTVSQIKSATEGSYASGGLIRPSGASKGGAYTDGLTAHVSAGEMIINESQQGRLWNIISGVQTLENGGLSGEIEFVLRGQDLYGSMKNLNKSKMKIGKNIGIK